MTDYHHDFRPGSVAVKFRQHPFDFIGMTLDIRGETHVHWMTDEDGDAFNHSALGGWRRRVPMEISSVHDGFPDLIAWLEAVTTGVERCEFTWNAEGPVGLLRVGDASPRTTDAVLSVGWPAASEKTIETRIDRRQLVGAFYQAFRRFVRCPRYDPVRYEDAVRYGDRLARENPEGLTEQEIIGHAIMHDRHTAEAWLSRIRLGPRYPNYTLEDANGEAPEARLERLLRELDELGDESPAAKFAPNPDFDYGYTHPLWNRMSTARRRQDIMESFDETDNTWWGANLRELRSVLVERWLGWVAPEDVRRRLGPTACTA